MWHLSAGSGTPVVFVHGAFCDYRFWEPQIEAVGCEWCAMTLSLSGFHPGPELAPAEFSAERHISELGPFLAAFQQPVHLVGHSRGGRIALNVAARFGQSVRSLVLIEPGGEMAPDFLLPGPGFDAKPPTSADVREEALGWIKAGDSARGLRLYIDAGHGQGRWDRLSSVVQRILLSNASTLAAMLSDRSGALSVSVAGSISCPTLLMAGSNSPPIFGRVLDALQAYLPQAKRHSVANADHFLTWDHTEAVNAALLEWLNSNKR
jgi:pimeloyl-ACP methyl ester carboxylesterase